MFRRQCQIKAKELVNETDHFEVFIRKELLAKRLEGFGTKSTGTICIELLISKRKWCIIFTYKPTKYDKKVSF